MCSAKYENLERDEVWVIRGGGGGGLWKVTEKTQWLSNGGRLYEAGLAVWL